MRCQLGAGIASIYGQNLSPGCALSPVGCQKLRGEVRGDEVLAQSVQVGGVSELVQR